jgi:hypothetical protein
VVFVIVVISRLSLVVADGCDVVVWGGCVGVVEWQARVKVRRLAVMVEERVVSPVAVLLHLCMRALVSVSACSCCFHFVSWYDRHPTHLLSVRVPKWQSFSFHA